MVWIIEIIIYLVYYKHIFYCRYKDNIIVRQCMVIKKKIKFIEKYNESQGYINEKKSLNSKKNEI